MSAPEVPPAKLGLWPLIVVIAVNLVPIFGVVFWGWSAFALIFLYWMENVVIGVKTLAEMAASAIASGTVGLVGLVFFGGFFTLHYGLFCFVHGTFVVAMFGAPALGLHMLDLAGATRALLTQEPNLLIGLASICIWQIVQLVLFIARGQARTANPLELMGAPYPRIIVLHLAIIFGGFLLMLLNEPVAGLVVLALVKMGFDIAEATGRAPNFGAALPASARKLKGGGKHPGPLSGPPTRR